MRYLILSILLANCAGNVAIKPDIKKSWPNADWQQEVYKRVQDMPKVSDGKEFCPNGMTPENWVHLLSAVAYYESGYSPAKVYREKFRNGRGELILSTGLFQISYEQSRHRDYGYPRVTTEQLKDPITNIDIAVKIAKRIVGGNGVVTNHSGSSWKGMARAWSVMRPSGKLSQIKARMREHCQ